MTRSPRRAAWLVAPSSFAALVLASCSLFRDVDALSRDYGAADASTLEGGGTEDAASVGDAAPGCLADHGQTMIPIPGTSSCIDPTEVTSGDYRAFVDAKGGDTSGQPSSCAWNTSYAPEFFRPDDHPITNVDWCDARAYCAWAGKRLCGALAGGPMNGTDGAGDERGQWYRACTGGDPSRAFPWGNEFVSGRCNGEHPTGGGDVAAVASFADCKGAIPGAFDLAGNVREWEDACDEDPDPRKRSCLVRGGAFYDIASTLACSNRQAMKADTVNPGVGFRCCSK